MLQKPSRQELRLLSQNNPEKFLDMVEHLFDTVNQLHRQIQQMAMRIDFLEKQKAKDSSNSGKPPSSDGFKRKRKTKSMRKKSGKKQGGQPGHKGANLKMVDKPDFIIEHELDICPLCHESLTDVPPLDTERRQVFDIPPLKIEVTEHRAEVKHCPNCQAKSTAAFPANVSNYTQYGQKIKAYASYLMNYQLLPFDRTSQAFADLFNHRISTGTLVNFQKEIYEKLAPFHKKIKGLLLNSRTLNVDESGMRVFGLNHWFHVVSNSLFTYYMHHKKRGQQAIDEMGILNNFKGTAMHDFFKPYLKYDCNHAFCNAHHLRELTFVHEQFAQNWALKMIKLLLNIKETVDQASLTATRLDKSTLKIFRQKYDRIIALGYIQSEEYDKNNPLPPQEKPAPRKQSPPKNLLDRMHIFADEILAFMYDFSVPFDNNQAERDIRMIKLQQKISGTFRSETGPAFFAGIRSYISTAQKQEANILKALENAFLGKPFIPSFKLAE